jgi:hypothetical protein
MISIIGRMGFGVTVWQVGNLPYTGRGIEIPRWREKPVETG